jgi:hypothetical protein
MADIENDAGHDGVTPDPKAKLGEEVAAQMEAIEADFEDDYEIGNVVTVVEVIGPEGAAIRVRCNQPPWVGIGMLRVAERVLEGQGEPG